MLEQRTNFCYFQIPMPVPEQAWWTRGKTTWLPPRLDMPPIIPLEPPQRLLDVSTRCHSAFIFRYNLPK